MKILAPIWTVVVVFAFFAGSYAAYAEDQPSIELGKKLFNDPSLGKNGKTCASCHNTDENIKKDTAKYPGDKGLKKIINACIEGNLNDKPLSEKSVEMESLIMYMRSVK